MGKIMSMDGESCGLDADLLDGKHGLEYATAKQGEKADSAVQGIKANGLVLPIDSAKAVNLTPENLSAVPIGRTINNKALSSDITLSYSDVGGPSSAQGSKAETVQYREFVGTERQFCPMRVELLTSRLKILKQCQLHGAWPRRTSRAQSVIKISIFSHANWACSTQFPNVRKVNAASIEQGNKADSAIQAIQGNGKIIQPDLNSSVVITPENIGAVRSRTGQVANVA